MATKVKGDKIKEGSIPLSALADDVKNVTGSYNVIAVFDAAGTYPFNFSDYYFCKVGNKFVSLSGIEDGQDILIYDGPPIYIKYEHNGIYSTCVITDVTGYIAKERPVEIVTINKSNSLFLPDDIGGGADWNAQEGESGYIKNKPFKLFYEDMESTIPNNFLKAEDFTHYEDEDGTIIYTSKNAYLLNGITTIVYLGRNDINTSIDRPVKGSFFIIAKYVDGNHVIPGIYGDIIFSEEYDEDAEASRLIINADTSENVFAYKIYVCDGDELNVETLPETYLPKTVLKTTPQTLSDTDKNQALANLGIDPVVWKYLANPYVIYVDEDFTPHRQRLPEDLMTLINKSAYVALLNYIVVYDSMTVTYYKPVESYEDTAGQIIGLVFNNNKEFYVNIEEGTVGM